MNNRDYQLLESRFWGAIILMFSIILNGCVSQEYIANSDHVKQERVINSKEAALARLKLALEYLRTGKTAQAKLNLDRAEKLAPEIDGIYSSYAYYYQQVGESSLADKSYLKALQQFPKNDNTRNNYGAFLCENHRYDEAENQFSISIESPLNTKVANSHENAGLCALRDNRWLRAKKHFSAVLRYESLRVRAILGLVKVNIELDDIDAAILHLNDYKRIYSQTSQSLWLAIQIEYKQRNIISVHQLGNVLLEKYPNSAAATSYLEKSWQ